MDERERLREIERPWICFHCGFETSDHNEAQSHFGERDDAQEFSPTCTWWSKLTAEERIQEIQDLRQQITQEQDENSLLLTRIEGLEYRVEGQLSEIHGFRPFRACDSIQQVFNIYDSMEGRALLAEEQLRAAREKIAWQPIETAPRDGTEFMGGWRGNKPFTSTGTPMCWQNSRERQGWFMLSPTYEDDKGEFFPGKWINERDAPTHWAPLLEPPK